MTKIVASWGSLFVVATLFILGCDQLERKPRPQTVEPTPTVQENNWNAVKDLPLGEIAQLALGYDHSCALDVDGKVACWGSNRFGELGAPLETPYSRKPLLVEGCFVQ